MRTPRSHPRLRAAGLATAGVLALTGCADVPPGAASVVNGHTITRAQVDQLADAQCAGVALAARQGQGQVVARKQLTQRALGLLIDIQLNLDFARSLELEPRPTKAAADFAQVTPLIDTLPTKYQPYLKNVFRRWADGRDMLTQLGENASGQAATQANAEQILNEGYAQRQTWLTKNADIDTSSIYSPGKVGWPGEGDSSVSQPVSSFAKSAASAQPSTAFLSGLPAGQRCG